MDRLVQSGFIRREEDAQDHRTKSLQLTDKGKQLIQEGIEEHYHRVEPLVGTLTAEERTKMDKFQYLKIGLAFVLTFVGVKMVMVDIYKIPVGISLGVIASILGISVLASLWKAWTSAGSLSLAE